MKVIILTFFIHLIFNQQIYLNNAPITFSLTGKVQYIPTTGGLQIPGYTFNLGFDRYSWIGKQTIMKEFNL